MIKIKHKILLSIILFSTLHSFAQLHASDTSFLLREYKNGSYHAIFIDTNKQSEFYNSVGDFDFDSLDLSTYKQSIEALKEINHKPFIKYDLLSLPMQWVSLFMYKGNYYVYAPSDYYNNNQVLLTDTTYVYMAGEGPVATRIESFKKIDKNSYFIGYNPINGGETANFIHIINQEKGIAVFENINADGSKRYRLMINAEKMRNFPIIVNYCKDMKQQEFIFDKPDFKKLLYKK